MITQEHEFYLRFILLLIQGGTEVLREIAAKALQKSNTHLNIFLSKNASAIQNTRDLSKKQIGILYPSSPTVVSNIKNYDITLLSYLITNFLTKNLDGNEQNAVDKIKEMRNVYHAHTHEAKMTASIYTKEWNKLVRIIYTVSYNLSEEKRNSLNEIIDSIENEPLDIKVVIDEIRKLDQTNDFFEHIKKSIDDLNENLDARFSRIEKDILEIKFRLENQGKKTKVVNTVRGQVTLSADEQETVDYAEKLLLEASKDIVEKSPKEHNKQLKQKVGDFLQDVEKLDIKVENVSKGSILFEFKCFSLSALLDLINFFNSSKFKARLHEIAAALEDITGKKINISGSLDIQSFHDVITKMQEKKYERVVNFEMECTGVDGLLHAVEIFEGGKAANSVNDLSTALSESVGKRVTLNTSIDIDQMQCAIDSIKEELDYPESDETSMNPSERGVGRQTECDTVMAMADTVADTVDDVSPHSKSVAYLNPSGELNLTGYLIHKQDFTTQLKTKCTDRKTSPAGEKTKRLKTVDEILCRLIKQFKLTLDLELPDDFSPPTEIANVRTKLREKHHVIIAGNSNKFVLESALFAIKDLEYDINRCVEMTDISDWRHIDPEDIDLVLCRDPFGNLYYDAQKAHGIANIFDSILHTVQPKDGTSRLDFILVTDVDYLKELKQTREHDLLDEVVLLTTSENQHVDLTTAAYQSLKQVGHSMDFPRYESQSGHSNVRTSLTHDPRTTNALHTLRGISASWRPYMDTYKTPGHVTAMADKYHRLICFVVDICCELLRKLFIKCAKADTLHTFSNLCGYLSQRKSKICKLRLRHDQYQLLFPANGVPDENKWDVTLLVTLIKNLFQVQPLINISLGEIRTIRNELQHIGSTSDMSNDDFEDYWMRLETATLTLARDVSSGTYEDDIRKKIDQTRNSNMPNLADCLIKFYEENGKEMRQELCVMKEEMKRLNTKTEELNRNMISVAANSTETTSKLRQVCVTKIEQTELFKLTLDLELPDDFSPPIEITHVKAKLREKHHVIIAGNSNSFLLKTALFVIRDLQYDINRCVEMTDLFDWIHIDPKDVDLVLCRDPFGNTFYDAQKAHGIANIFDSILHTVQPKDGTNLLDFILVTDVDYLNELKQTREHDLLDEVVLLTTSENQPVDLTTAAYQSLKQVGHSMDFPRYITDRILDNYSENLVNIDEAKLEEASNLLKSLRMVVITGPPKSGKTSTAVALAKSYKSEEVLFLRSPGDIKKIDPRITVLVIIDDFGGKYCFDLMEVNKWFSVLDWLHEEVTAGKLQLIVTGETEKLQTIREIAPHPLLLNPVILTRRQIHVPIKQEPSEIGSVLDESQSGHSSNVRNTPALNLTTTSALHEKRGISTSLIPSKDSTKKSGHVTGSVFWDNNAGLQLQIANVPSLQVVRSVQSVRQYRVRIDSDKKSCYIKGCCILPGGEILLADFDNNRLKKLNSAYNVISVCDLPGCPRGVCYIRNNVAVVTVFKQLVYVDVSSMTVRNTVTIDHWCDSITCHNNKLYLKSEDTVYIYTLDGNNRSTLYNLQNSSFVISGIAVGGDGNMIYIADGNHRLITIDNFGNLLNSLTFPDARAVCVDDRSNVWVGDMYTKNLYQVSADGARLLGTVSVDELNGTWALCYDRDRSSLIVASGLDDNIRVVRLD